MEDWNKMWYLTIPGNFVGDYPIMRHRDHQGIKHWRYVWCFGRRMLMNNSWVIKLTSNLQGHQQIQRVRQSNTDSKMQRVSQENAYDQTYKLIESNRRKTMGGFAHLGVICIKVLSNKDLKIILLNKSKIATYQ